MRIFQKVKHRHFVSFFFRIHSSNSNDSIKPILIHDHSSPRHRDHHVQVAADDPTLSPEEQGSIVF